MKMPAWLKSINKTQAGFGLVETLVAVAILGTSVVAFVAALATGSLTVSEQESETAAQRLAMNQIEYTKNQAFNPSGIYSLVTAPSGYTVVLDTGTVAGTDADMQMITVTVLRDGNSVFTLSGYKVNR